MWTCSSITVQQTDFSHTECEYFKYIKFIVSTHTNSTVWRLVWVWECVLACMSGSQEKPNEPKCKKSEKNARKTIIITVTHKYTFLYGISTRKKKQKKGSRSNSFLAWLFYFYNCCRLLLFAALTHSLLWSNKQRRGKNNKRWNERGWLHVVVHSANMW